MQKLWIIAAMIGLLIPAAAQDSLLTEKLRPLTRTFQLKDGQLSGDGRTFFQETGKTASFFLIGEDHGMAEFPLFTAALFRAFQPLGYEYFATETGPYSAGIVQALAADPDWRTRFQDHFRQYPWSIPFYYWQEECEIPVAVMSDAQPGKLKIWGLDQEFAVSFQMLFNVLEKDATSAVERETAAVYATMAAKADGAAISSGDPSQSFLAVVKPEDFERLKLAFGEKPRSLELIRELEESVQIYQLWFVGEGYESNRRRAEMMKRHFMQYYTSAKTRGEQPKVMFKFGANHLYRGLNALNVPDIGNFVSELAGQEGTQSFHLYALGRKGTQNAFTPFSKSDADKKQPYDAGQYLDRIDFSAALKAVPENEWAVIDLRPLRKALFNREIKNVNEGLKRLIWSYDALLIVPEVRASVFFGE